MDSSLLTIFVLISSILLIVFTIIKLKLHPFLALLLSSFYVGLVMQVNPLEILKGIESGIGGTLGFLASIIGLGTILGKMLEVSGAA